MYAAHDVATYVITEYWNRGSIITNLKLQKILYYIQGYAYRFCNTAAFCEDIYKWPYGPVVPDVYFRYNHHHASPLQEPAEEDKTSALFNLKRDTALFSVVKDVIQASIKYSAAELVNKPHQELPWGSATDNSIISNQAIAGYFFENNPLNINRK